MRLVRITLATKYRILFGLAVILIIGAALSWPWYLVRALVDEQPFREAQRVANDYFRHMLVGGEPRSPAVHAVEPQPGLREPARFLPATADETKAPPAEDVFAVEALGAMRANPSFDFFHTTTTEPDGAWFRYAQAVRVRKRCLECHDEGKSAQPYREGQLAGVITVTLPRDSGPQGLLLQRTGFVVAGTLAGILAILVFYVITKKFILAPIHEIGEVTIRVAEGDLDVRSTTRTGDEFEQLSDNLNAMLERLRTSQNELKKANQLLDQKLGEMAETNVALYESNRLKSEFLANVSHELRTPLTSIIGFAELLREGPQMDGNGRAARYAENILVSGRILLEMINDLLDLAKIEAGRIELQIETVHPEELCRALTDFVRPLADERRIDVQSAVDDRLPALLTDRGKLRQVLFNLLSNAVKFTPKGGDVRIEARRLGEHHVRLAVADSGPGVAPEHRQLIFEKFRQIDQSTTREHPGTGLGLAIAKELTELLGGEIGVEERAGGGAVFWVKLATSAPEQRDRPLVSLV